MVTKEQFKNGLLRYIDGEVMPALPTTGKWVAGAAVTLASSKFDKILNDFASNPMIKALNIIDPETGMINAEEVLDALRQSAEKYGTVQLDIPLVGILGFKAVDVDKLKSYVVEGGMH